MTDRGTLAAMGAVALAALSAVGGVGVTLWRGGGRYAQIIGGMDALKREGQKLRQDFERHEEQAPPEPAAPTFGRRPSSSGITSSCMHTWVCTSVSKESARSTGRCGSTLEPGGRTMTFRW